MLPTFGPPARVLTFDLHTLQNRFYFHTNCLATLHSTIPLILEELHNTSITSIAFPDEGAQKRFARDFKGERIATSNRILHLYGQR